jgi:teichuronic acid biosynthesis glycosyltransferase TuaC
VPDKDPALIVFSSLFPHPGQPNAGLFIRERMFRVGRTLPIKVVAPVPWFPLQGLLRRWRPHFRPDAPRNETQSGVEVFHPRYFSIPGICKSLDGLFMALGSFTTLRRIRREFDFQVIDSHFAYPDGYAATLLGRWLGVPVTITLRGTEARLAKSSKHRRLMQAAMASATRIFSVAEALKQTAVDIGVPPAKVRVVGNGVDLERFQPIPREAARQELGLKPDAQVLVSIGGLCERKGFHRVIACLPELKQVFPGIHLLVVGGPSAEGDWTAQLHQQVADLNLHDVVTFLGALPPDRLKVPLSAANVFVLSTRNEGWANVFLEAMACGLPVVTTDVGGNSEVVCRPELGYIVPFDQHAALKQAIAQALQRPWDTAHIEEYARQNSWDQRVAILVQEFRDIAARAQLDSTHLPPFAPRS